MFTVKTIPLTTVNIKSVFTYKRPLTELFVFGKVPLNELTLKLNILINTKMQCQIAFATKDSPINFFGMRLFKFTTI